MKIKTYDIKTIIILSTFTVVALILSIGGTLTKGNPWQGVLVSWVSFGGFLLVTLIHIYRNSFKYKIYSSKYNLYITWTDYKYSVNLGEVEAVIDLLINKLDHRYTNSKDAISNCLITFREPIWLEMNRTVAGIQDNQLIDVGWCKDLARSALTHELCHRIMQVLAGDPGEAHAHKIMTELGI